MVAKVDAAAAAHAEPVVSPLATGAAPVLPSTKPAEGAGEKLAGTPADGAGEKPADKPADEQKPVEAPAKPDVAALTKEFAETGSLSEASYAALESAGLTKDVVDSYIAGQVALAAQRDAVGYSHVGGKEAFTAMATWAASALAPADVEVLNRGLSGSDAEMKAAVLSLKAQYEAANGKAPQLTTGSGAGANEAATPFASRAEVTAAMRDPRYKNDPAYRATVEWRVGLMENF